MKVLSFLLIFLQVTPFTFAQEAKPTVYCDLHYWASKDSNGKILKSNLFPSFEVEESKEFDNEGFNVKVNISEVCTAEGTGCRADRFSVMISKNGSQSLAASYIQKSTYGSLITAGLIVGGEIYKMDCRAKAPKVDVQ